MYSLFNYNITVYNCKICFAGLMQIKKFDAFKGFPADQIFKHLNQKLVLPGGGSTGDSSGKLMPFTILILLPGFGKHPSRHFPDRRQVIMYKNKTELADALYRELDDKVCDMYDAMEIEDFRRCFKKVLEDYTLVCTSSIVEED